MSEKDFVALLESHLSSGAMYEIHNLADALCSVLTKEKLEQLVSQINWNVSK
jgi:ATP-dependent Clp protease adapter protein ClpS